jgi:FAD/FMN-containing dehydrogenase
VLTKMPDIENFSGPLLRPPDPGYQEALPIWNGMIQRRPALIARCLCPEDVHAAVRFGVREGIEIAVRGGGHNITGNALSDGGLVIDLSLMRTVEVDPPSRIARAQPGARLADVDTATMANGLATPLGINSTTGIAGLTLGGGIGWLMRAFGLSCDNLRAAEVVLATGEQVTAGAGRGQDADLLWALRGGGGNFGVVTRFDYDLHPVGPTVLAGGLLYPAARAREVLAFYRDFINSAPDLLTTIVGFRLAPPVDWIPTDVQGTPVVALLACYAGPIEEGREVMRPFREQLSPVADALAPMPFTDLQKMLDTTVPAGLQYYWKSHFLPTLNDAAIDTLLGRAYQSRSPLSFALLFHLGGAIRRVSDGATAFTGRHAEHALNICGVWPDREDPNDDRDWVRATFDAMAPFATGVYVNFLMSEGPERVRAAYGPEKYARLASLKARYDPTNIFHLNQNILPAKTGDRR